MFEIVFPCSLKIEAIWGEKDSGAVFFVVEEPTDEDSVGAVGDLGFVDVAEGFLECGVSLLCLGEVGEEF